MKNLLLAAMFVVFTAVSSEATAYFRLIDPAHPHLSAGAFIDPVTPGDTSAGTSLALITHSPVDGCYLPSVVCENWAPLTVGVSAHSGRVLLGVGPSFNLAPLVKAGLLKVVNAVTQEDHYQNLKSLLSSEPLSQSDLSISFGPDLVLNPSEKWKGHLLIFTGAAWRF